MAVVKSQLSEFDREEFFRSLEAYLSSSLSDNSAFNAAEYFFRRLDGFEMKIIALFKRLRKSFPTEEQLLINLRSLLEIVCRRRDVFTPFSLTISSELLKSISDCSSVGNDSRSRLNRPIIFISKPSRRRERYSAVSNVKSSFREELKYASNER